MFLREAVWKKVEYGGESKGRCNKGEKEFGVYMSNDRSGVDDE